MKRTVLRVLGALVMIVFLIAAFSGCEMITSGGFDPALVSGYWKSDYGDGFEIVEEAADWMYYQYDDAAKSVSYAGKIVSDNLFFAESDYITIEITEAGTWMKDAGEYYRIHYKDLTADSIKQSSAYLFGGDDDINDGVPTQSGAENTFTVENGYFGYHGDYERQ